MLLPAVLDAVKLMLQFPGINVCVALFVFVLNCSQVELSDVFFSPHFHSVGVFVDVSLNTIVNGDTPDQP